VQDILKPAVPAEEKTKVPESHEREDPPREPRPAPQEFLGYGDGI